MLTKERLLELGVSEENANIIITDLNKDHIPKYRYNEVTQERDNLKEQIEDRDKQINNLSKNKGNAEELQKEIEELKEQNKADKVKHEEAIKGIQKENAIEQYLQSNHVTNVKAFKKLLDTESITYEEDKLKGIDEQIKTLKEDKSLSSLFADVNSIENSIGYDVAHGNREPGGKGLFDDILNNKKPNNDFNPWG